MVWLSAGSCAHRQLLLPDGSQYPHKQPAGKTIYSSAASPAEPALLAALQANFAASSAATLCSFLCRPDLFGSSAVQASVQPASRAAVAAQSPDHSYGALSNTQVDANFSKTPFLDAKRSRGH